MKMLRSSVFIVVLFAVFIIFTLSAHATLELRGTDVNGNRLIYDSDFNITWYDYMNNQNSWQNQMNWAANLSVSGGDLVGVYDDWRLPTALNQDGTGPCDAYNCTGSEMGHLYYTELGNIAGAPLTKSGDFQGLLPRRLYWLDMEVAYDTRLAWVFDTYGGGQGGNDKNYGRYGYGNYAIAVRTGDVSVAVVPEPVSMILFGVGGVVLGARRMV